ncbi:MAG: dTMP kinase [Helicobacteraceae bacterium 4484_230]|nr:MAG: dTMP kinase [Helicobacteraceae bacterium 4484_230]
MYIAIEGVDTAGKSTQITQLQKSFENAVITKEPGGTPAGSMIRDIVLNTVLESQKAEFLLFLADRAEHIESVVRPNLDRLIISDRSVVSGIAYALVRGEISETAIIHMNRFATGGVYPDKVFLLQLSEKELRFRLSQKELDGIEIRGVEYLLDIQDALVKAAKLIGIELVIIDASRSIDAITKEILNNIKEAK